MNNNKNKKVIIIGSGVFGLGTGRELKKRGYKNITIFEKDDFYSSNSASFGLSRIVRPDYGYEDIYVDMSLDAINEWKKYNNMWGENVYNETGIVFLSENNMELNKESQEYTSYMNLRNKYNINLERLNTKLKITKYSTLFRKYNDGYYNPKGGWVDNGKAMFLFKKMAIKEGIKIYHNTEIEKILYNDNNNKAIGVKIKKNNYIYLADLIIVSSGAWTLNLLPELKNTIIPSGHPIILIRPQEGTKNYELLKKMPTVTFDITSTGFYGFPLTDSGLFKIAHHGKEISINPDINREVDIKKLEKGYRKFIKKWIPDIKNELFVQSRCCFYCDTYDSHFIIDYHPTKDNLFVATGGNGTAFKMAPVIGKYIVDIIEKKSDFKRYKKKFGWRINNSQNKKNDLCRSDSKVFSNL